VFLATIGGDEVEIEASFCAAIRTAKEQKSISLAPRPRYPLAFSAELPDSLTSFNLRKILLVRGCAARCFRATPQPRRAVGRIREANRSRPSRVLRSGAIWVSRRLESWPAIFKVPTRIDCNWRGIRWTSPVSPWARQSPNFVQRDSSRAPVILGVDVFRRSIGLRQRVESR